MGGTEEACPLGEGASGQQLPVRFQAGGPAHLLTEELFMGLGSLDGGKAGHGGLAQVRAAPESAERWEAGGGANLCLSQSD